MNDKELTEGLGDTEKEELSSLLRLTKSMNELLERVRKSRANFDALAERVRTTKDMNSEDRRLVAAEMQDVSSDLKSFDLGIERACKEYTETASKYGWEPLPSDFE